MLLTATPPQRTRESPSDAWADASRRPSSSAAPPTSRGRSIGSRPRPSAGRALDGMPYAVDVNTVSTVGL